MERRDLTGKILARRYELVGFLGNGAFGAVYEARNDLGKRFAVKVLLSPQVTSDQHAMARFFREAKAAAAIESAHIVNVYETGIDGELDAPFIVMELLRGEDLEKAMSRIGAFSSTAAARVITQAALGLERAHAAGVVHRDVKPANLFLSTLDSGDVVVKVLDFGIAKAAASDKEQASLTRTGAVMGTPLYMSPEQATGSKTVDERADVWSLGVCLYHLLAGSVPWGDVETLAALYVRICAEDAPPLEAVAPSVDRGLSAVVMRTLLRDPQKRTRSMRALIEELSPFCAGSTQVSAAMLVAAKPPAVAPASPEPTTSIVGLAGTAQRAPTPPRRVMAIVAGVVGVAVLFALGFVATRSRDPEAASSAKPATPATGAASDAPPLTASTTTTTAPAAAEPPTSTTVTATASPTPKASASSAAPIPRVTGATKPQKKPPPAAPTSGDPFGGTKH